MLTRYIQDTYCLCCFSYTFHLFSTRSRQVEVLKALAATGPGNLRAAENVAASVASSLIRAAGERTVDLLQLHQSAVEKRYVLLVLFPFCRCA